MVYKYTPIVKLHDGLPQTEQSWWHYTSESQPGGREIFSLQIQMTLFFTGNCFCIELSVPVIRLNSCYWVFVRIKVCFCDVLSTSFVIQQVQSQVRGRSGHTAATWRLRPAPIWLYQWDATHKGRKATFKYLIPPKELETITLVSESEHRRVYFLSPVVHWSASLGVQAQGTRVWWRPCLSAAETAGPPGGWTGSCNALESEGQRRRFLGWRSGPGSAGWSWGWPDWGCGGGEPAARGAETRQQRVGGGEGWWVSSPGPRQVWSL